VWKFQRNSRDTQTLDLHRFTLEAPMNSERGTARSVGVDVCRGRDNAAAGANSLIDT
jgi:hypothetical protein